MKPRFVLFICRLSLDSFSFGLGFAQLPHKYLHKPIFPTLLSILKSRTYSQGQIFPVSRKAQSSHTRIIPLILPDSPLSDSIPQCHKPISTSRCECPMDRMECQSIYRIYDIDSLRWGLPVAFECVLSRLFDSNTTFNTTDCITSVVWHACHSPSHKFQSTLPTLPRLNLKHLRFSGWVGFGWSRRQCFEVVYVEVAGGHGDDELCGCKWERKWFWREVDDGMKDRRVVRMMNV